MLPKKILPTFLVCLILAVAGCTAGSPENAAAPGQNDHPITIKQITSGNKGFLLATIDPSLYQLKIIVNTPPPDSKNIQILHQENHSLLTFNGSFFDQNFKPLGMLVSEGKLIFPLTKSDLMNGVFTINHKGQPQLFDYSNFQDKQEQLLPAIDFAIQSGPILIDDKGAIVVDRKNLKTAGRTAIGLDKSNNIVVIMLRQSLLDETNALSLYDFADTLLTAREFSDLGIHSLINLDGGTSSGLAVNDQYFPELEKVQNVIIAQKHS